MPDASEIRSLLEDRPELELALRTVLEPAEPWTFEDVDVDSGAFGELVSHGVVESDGDDYRVSDRRAVKWALAGPDEARSGGERRVPRVDIELPTVDRVEALGVVAGLVLVVLARSLSFPNVFYEGEFVHYE